MATPLDPAVARARFGVFVQRALDQARARGMTDKDIYQSSGVSSSTFHRWKLGHGRDLPQLDKVRRWCQAVGASVEDAMKALGMTDAPAEPTAEPPLPQDVRVIMRRLADPNTSEIDKQFIRMTLRMLAARIPSGAEAPTEEEAAG